MKKVKILIATHKEFSPPLNNIFLPIQVGRSLTKKKLEFQGDNEGENISERNNQFCELTAIYWMWKNENDYDYIGLCHYRRFFTFDQVPFLVSLKSIISFNLIRYVKNPIFPGSSSILWQVKKVNKIIPFDVSHSTFSQRLDLILKNNDIITIKKVKLSSTNIKSFWSLAVSNQVFDKVEICIKKRYPEILSSYLKTIYGNKIHPCNMAIFEKNIFNQYAQFVFTILFETEQLLKELEIVPLPRTLGYIGEVLTSAFISYKKDNGTKVKTLNMLVIIDSI